MGYSFYSKRNKHIARIMINGIRVHLGSYNTAHEAIRAYARAELMEEMRSYFTIDNYNTPHIETRIPKRIAK